MLMLLKKTGSDDSDEFDFGNDIDKSESSSKLRDDLAAWSARWQISGVAFTALLTLLSVYFPSLPKDSRTVKQTPRMINVKTIAGGSYFHFGIVAMLSKIASGFSELVLGATQLLIQVNIDGLPLFKSSGVQLWPILGRVCSPFESEPFVIGLFSGKQKPGNIDEYLE